MLGKNVSISIYNSAWTSAWLSVSIENNPNHIRYSVWSGVRRSVESGIWTSIRRGIGDNVCETIRERI